MTTAHTQSATGSLLTTAHTHTQSVTGCLLTTAHTHTHAHIHIHTQHPQPATGSLLTTTHTHTHTQSTTGCLLTTTHTIFLRFSLIFSSYLCPGLSVGLLDSCFQPRTLCDLPVTPLHAVEFSKDLARVVCMSHCLPY